MDSETDLACLYIIAPLVGNYIITWLNKDTKNTINIIEEWISKVIWIFVYLILGYLMFRAKVFEDNNIFWLLVILTIDSYIIQTTYKYDNGTTALLFMSCFLSLSIIIDLFFSNMIDDESPESLGKGNIYLISLVFLWFLLILINHCHVKNDLLKETKNS